jgi:peptidyl-tRNA hydrolase, PTH1 family
MQLIIGLGNPEKDYKNTRHNIGFEVINVFSDNHNIPINKNNFKSHIGSGSISGKKIMLVKPQTFMNLSGESVKALLTFYKLTPKDIIVVYDDIHLDIGKIRIKTKGSSGGQNGMKNIISHLGTDEFIRVRVGVGNKPTGYDLSDYVLSKFKKDELSFVDDGITKACSSIISILKNGVFEAMNEFN